MNRSCNSILCRFGIHTADPYVHIQVKCRNSSHRWQSNYEICKRCGEQEEGLWRLLGRAEGFEGTVFTEESDED